MARFYPEGRPPEARGAGDTLPEVSLHQQLSQRFDFLRRLGTGSFGEVFEVEERSTGARYALKIVQVQGDGRRERREIETCLRLDHPRVIRCFEGAVQGPQAFLLLELAETSLATRLRDSLRLAENWQALRQAVEGVAALHARGLVHRDLKPANLLLVGGHLKIADLGLTRGEGLETMTATGTILGTPGYLSPEQARGEKVEAPSDVFSLGVMFYECLELRLPYPNVGPLEMLQLVARGEIEDFHRARHLLAPELLENLRTSLDPDPAARPRDLNAWLERLGDPAGLGELSAAYQRPLRASGDTGRRRRASGDAPRAELSDPHSTVRRRARPGRFPRWLGPVAVLAALLVGVLGAPEAPPAAPSAPEATTAAGAASEAPFDEGFATAIRDRLTDLQGWFVDSQDRLVERRQDGGGEVHELADLDPLRFAVLVRHIPGLVAFEDWLVAGGRPEELDAALVQDLRGTDEFFLRQGLPRPFAPYLGLRPEPRPGVQPGWSYLRGQGMEDLPEGPTWSNTAVRLASDTWLRSRDLERRLRTETPEDLPAEARSFLNLWRRTTAPGADSHYALFESYYGAPSLRVALLHYMREGTETAKSVLYALRRAAREEPGSAALACMLVAACLEDTESYFYSDLAVHPADPLRELPSTPALELVRAILQSRRSGPFQTVAARDTVNRLRRGADEAFRHANSPPFGDTPPERIRRWFSATTWMAFFLHGHLWARAAAEWPDIDARLRTSRPDQWWVSVDRVFYSVRRSHDPRAEMAPLVEAVVRSALDDPAPVPAHASNYHLAAQKSLGELRTTGAWPELLAR